MTTTGQPPLIGGLRMGVGKWINGGGAVDVVVFGCVGVDGG